jgi:arylsulfatase A-like enzyme
MRLGRRRSIALATGGAVAAFIAAIAMGAEPEVPAPAVIPEDAPNILIIVTDDQRANTIEFMPNTKRWFLNGGQSYKHAVAVNPVCCPSRASIFTGLYSHNNGVLTNGHASELDHATTAQASLQAAGYQTYIAGKFLNDWPIGEEPPYFDRWAIFDDALEGQNNNLYRNETWNVQGTVVQKPGYTTKLIGGYALDHLEHSESDDDSPWLMYVFPFAPHDPYAPARKYRDARVGPWDGNPAVFASRRERPWDGNPAVFASRRERPPWVRPMNGNLAAGREIRRGQLRTLMSVDDMVGDLMLALGENEERSNTLALYTSDNGIHWGEHGLLTKRFPYKASYRVPMMWRWPGELEPGTSSEKIVGNVDIAPTVSLAAGQPVSSMDGRSMFDSGPRERLLLEGYAREGQPDNLPPWAATLTPDYQYTEYYGESGELIFREYFDLNEDPFQIDNLLRDGNPADHPDPAELSATLMDDRDCGVGVGECP